jgi:hypothetical protein
MGRWGTSAWLSVRYFPQNLYFALFKGPDFQTHFPWIMTTNAGQSLLTTSPAFLLALRAPWQAREVKILSLMTGLSLIVIELIYIAGWTQLGMRYWIIVYPFLMALMAMKPTDQFPKILIIASVIFMIDFTWQARYYNPF